MQKIVNWILGLVFVFGFLITASPVLAETLFRSGEIMDARNVTKGETAWSRSVKANNLDEIEFRVFIENIGDTESSDVHIRVGFALDPGSTLENRIYVGTWSTPSVRGETEIEVESNVSQKLVYVPGKAVKFGAGCDGCAVSDKIASAYGTYVGKVKPAEKIEVRFRAQVTDRQARVLGTATTPTPTPTTKPNAVNTANTSNSGGTGGAGGAAVASTTPKTGFTDPFWMRTLVWLAVGGAGIGLRQIARKMSRIEA